MIWYIAVGSAIGGASRYLLASLIQARVGAGFPVGTLVINVTGSFILGFLLQSTLGSTTVSPEIRGFLTTGFCGGYTTFSTYSFETAALIQNGQYGRATVYATVSVVGALLATFAGIALAQAMFTFRERI